MIPPSGGAAAPTVTWQREPGTALPVTPTRRGLPETPGAGTCGVWTHSHVVQEPTRSQPHAHATGSAETWTGRPRYRRCPSPPGGPTGLRTAHAASETGLPLWGGGTRPRPPSGVGSQMAPRWDHPPGREPRGQARLPAAPARILAPSSVPGPPAEGFAEADPPSPTPGTESRTTVPSVNTPDATSDLS